jgi:hypothetical protein
MAMIARLPTLQSVAAAQGESRHSPVALVELQVPTALA